jgi:hypothetical protein
VLAPPDADLRVLYNVSRPVGPEQTNREDDGLLVQFCLQKVFDNPNVFDPPFPLPANRKRIETGGTWRSPPARINERPKEEAHRRAPHVTE